ncbi:MaoC family dehydratase N-terminal domain-containing protein [Roseovarius indicus]|uniref:MaoC family dehydratase N-terminal domain-containing protein n=1 Tax=Roseovarius indicus TaxID=540747 RepID=UPI0032EF68B8
MTGDTHLDQGLVGRRLPPLDYAVETGQLRFFAQVVGETDPVCHDIGAARAAGYRSIVAPPTFPFSALRGATADMPVVAALGLDAAGVNRLLHGEQEFDLLGPICAGDRLSIEERITAITPRKGGALEIVSTATRITNQLGDEVARMRMQLVYRVPDPTP